MTKRFRIWLISIFVALAVPLVGVIVVEYMVNGEEICLDRHPWWGPPNDPNVYTSCSGHWYERHQPSYPPDPDIGSVSNDVPQTSNFP